MNWHERITVNPDVLVGKPIIKGTRISVEMILNMLGAGWTEQDILRNYPHLVENDIRACLKYAAESVANELVALIPA